MTTKIDVRVIISDHFKTLQDEGTGKLSPPDFVVMIGFPAALAGMALYFGFGIEDHHVATLVAVFAIFAGLLFNVLVLIYSFSETQKSDKKEIREKLLKQSFANISYSIIISLCIVVTLTFVLFVDGTVQRALGAAVIFFAINFFLSLLMVLKRIHVLLRDKFGG